MNEPRSYYKSVPLSAYSDALRDRTTALFGLVSARLGQGRMRTWEGSYSVLRVPSLATAAKIVIYEQGKGDLIGAALQDGVYVWIRVPGAPASRTLAIQPHYDERFAYFRLAGEQELEEMADFIAAYSDRDE